MKACLKVHPVRSGTDKTKYQMEKILRFTKDQLIEAFKLWNNQYLDNPIGFDGITRNEDSAKSQAEHLLSLIQNPNTFKIPEETQVLTSEDEELIRIESEAYNAVRNGIDWGKAEGDLDVEVILYAMKYLQENPGASIPDAIDHGLGEWLK